MKAGFPYAKAYDFALNRRPCYTKAQENTGPTPGIASQEDLMPRNEADTRATAVETQDFASPRASPRASLRASLRTSPRASLRASLQDHPEFAAYTETITAIFATRTARA